MHLKGQKLRNATRRINTSSLLGSFLGSCLWPGLVLSTLCLSLGMSEFQIGLVNATPNIVLPAQIFAAFLLIRFENRKKSWLIYVFSARLCIALLGIILLMQVQSPDNNYIWSFMALFALMHLTASMSLPLWFSWVGDLIPEREMPSFWGQRNLLINISGLFFSLGLGYALDLQHKIPSILGLILLTCSALTLIEILWGYLTLPSQEFKKENISKLSISSVLKNAFSNHNFRCFSSYGMLVSFATFLIVPFFFIHFKNLGLSNFKIQIFMAILSLGAMAGSLFWSSLASYIPNKQVLLICVSLKSIIMLGYFYLNAESTLSFQLVLFSVDGFINGGIVTLSMSLLTAETPSDQRSLFTALYFSIIGITGFIGSTLSGYLMEQWKDIHIAFFTLNFGGFHFLLIGFLIFHTFSLIPLCFYNSSMSGTTWNSMLMLFEGNPFLSMLRLTKLTGKKSHKQRLHFIRRNRSKLFLPEILEAIDDPSPGIRQAAVYSLGFFRDKRCEQKLIEVCSEKVLGLEHLAIEGLGRMKSSKASKMLMEYLNSNDVLARKTSAWALGQIKDRSSLVILKQKLADEKNHAIAAELADALSQFGDLSSIPNIFPHFKKHSQTCLRRQFGVALANILGNIGEFYPMLVEEQSHPGVSRSRICKDLQKKGASNKWASQLQDHFDEDQYQAVIRICFKEAFNRYYPNLNLEAMTQKEVLSWNNEDFDKAVGGMDSLIKQTGSIDYTLWLLTILNVQLEGQSEADLADALLSLYLLNKIY